MSSIGTIFAAYGAGRTSGKFEPVQYMKKPEVILRAFGWLFSIIVFGCIADKGYIYIYSPYFWSGYYCVYNGNEDACNFGIAIGVISFIGLMAFLVADAVFDVTSSIQLRKYIVVADVCYSCAWGFMWLVCFCFLADMWRRQAYGHYSTAQAAIAFSFFSLVVYIILAVLAIIRLRRGITLASDANMPPPGESAAAPPPYASAAYGHEARFSPHPFSPKPGETFQATTEQPAY